jgi:hypothetical protein
MAGVNIDRHSVQHLTQEYLQERKKGYNFTFNFCKDIKLYFFLKIIFIFLSTISKFSLEEKCII